MNLKRIIKEEMNDSLGWINDIKPALNQDQEWIVVNDVNPSDIEEGIKIQKYLFNLGYKWFSSELIKDTIYSIHHFPSKSLRGDLTYYNNKENERNLADRDIERNNNVYYWSQIKPKLNESDEDDPLQWIKEPRENDLDGLKLGYHPSHNDDPMVVIDNGGDEVIIRTSKNGDHTYDRRTVKAFIERGAWDIITESDDPLQWIKDIKPTPKNPQKGLIYQFYNYPDSLHNENIKTDNIIITAVVDDRVYFDTVDRYWANHPSDPGSDIMDKKAFSRMVNRGEIKYIGPSRVNESNELQWIKDIKLELPKNENWVIINDIDQESLEVSEEIQNFLFEQGYIWLSGRQSFLANKVASISHRKENNKFSYMPNGSSIKEIINFYKMEMGMEDEVFYYWSQLSKGDFTKTEPSSIVESNELDWMGVRLFM